jgi:hypothetical protein
VNKLAVYTCITGDFNALQPHPPTPGVDWMCFTDAITVPMYADQPDDWHLVPLTVPPGVSPRRLAKSVKLYPHQVLDPEVKASIWIDGTARVTSEAFPYEAFNCVGAQQIAMWRHPERDCIYDEAVASLPFPKYTQEPILDQVAHYWRAGFPLHGGLWAAGVIARIHGPSCGVLADAWMAEITRWSIQDQLSLPPVLHRLGLVPGAFPGSLYANDWLTITGHNPNA